MFKILTMKLFVMPLGLVIMVAISFSDTVPLSHRCTISDSKEHVDCSGLQLTETNILVNRDEQEQIRTVDFSNNDIQELERLDRFPKVRKLDLHMNKIKKIPIHAFSALEMLEEINLSLNDIDYLDPYIFINNKHLKRVNLEGNSLRLAADKPILCSSSLRYLNIATCEIPRITTENVLCMPSLTDLDLNSNGLTSLSPSVLSPLTNLRSISLSSNRFSCDCRLSQLLNWARTMKTDVPSSEPVYCVLPNNGGKTEFGVKEKELNCSANTIVPNSIKSTNENASSEFYDYILISYDTNMQPRDSHVSLRYMGIISSKLYTIEALLSLVLFLLVVITGMLFCRHYRTVGNVSDTVSEYSVYDNFVPTDMSKPLFEKNRKEPSK